MRRVLCAALAFSLFGCVGPPVRREAAQTLRCPEGKVDLKQRPNGAWQATGCGRMAICVVPEVPGADVQCSGGGETARP